jgi:hypothetical protein
MYLRQGAAGAKQLPGTVRILPGQREYRYDVENQAWSRKHGSTAGIVRQAGEPVVTKGGGPFDQAVGERKGGADRVNVHRFLSRRVAQVELPAAHDAMRRVQARQYA